MYSSKNVQAGDKVVVRDDFGAECKGRVVAVGDNSVSVKVRGESRKWTVAWCDVVSVER